MKSMCRQFLALVWQCCAFTQLIFIRHVGISTVQYGLRGPEAKSRCNFRNQLLGSLFLYNLCCLFIAVTFLLFCLSAWLADCCGVPQLFYQSMSSDRPTPSSAEFKERVRGIPLYTLWAFMAWYRMHFNSYPTNVENIVSF